MKSSTAKRWRAAVGGLALLALSAVFNSAALADEPAVPAPDPAPVTTQDPAPPAAVTEQAAPLPPDLAQLSPADRAMTAGVIAIGTAIDAGQKDNPRYRPAADSAVQAQIDALIATMTANGGNGDLFPQPAGLAMMGGSGMTAFAAIIQIAVETNRPDLVDAFLAAGADPRQVAPDQWTPMDYAVVQFVNGQQMSRPRAEAAFTVIRRLEAAGAPISDAKNFSAQLKPAEWKDIALNLIGLEIVENGGITLPTGATDLLRGPAATRTDLSDETALSRAYVQANGATLIHNEYTDAYPGGMEPYSVAPGDTLTGIAMRYYNVMGQRSPLHALSVIMNANDLPASAALQPGQKLMIPVPPNVQVGMVQFRGSVSLRDYATEILKQGIFYKRDATPETVMRELAQVNGIDEAAVMADTYRHPAARPLVMLFYNDSFDHLQPLTPPADIDPDRRVELVIIEDKDYHGKRTYGVATSTGYALNRNLDFSRFFAWDENLMEFPSPGVSPALRALLGDPANPLRDRLVFSHSMEMSVGQPGIKQQTMDQMRQTGEAEGMAIETMLSTLRTLEAGSPIVFTAAGNQYANGEGPYKQSFAVSHAPRTIIVGAAGKYPVFVGGQVVPAYVMAPYSTGGADVCAPLPYYLTEQQEGTSFSTPLTATTYRQFSEWYGHRLTQEEIMAAALMTADRNVLDYDNPLAAGQSSLPAQFRAHMATFRTNAAGLPYHDRCGAGVIDIERWRQTLDQMVALKAAPNVNGALHSQFIPFGQPVAVPDENGAGQYVYRIPVSADMTLGKLTFAIPQYPGQYSDDITVRTPGGFEQVLPRSVFQVVSTHAFAYEDVRAGSYIEIRSDKPMSPLATMVLRGHTGVNAIALLRDALRAGGVLPAPLVTLGGQEATSPPPQAPANAVIDLPGDDDEPSLVMPDTGTPTNGQQPFLSPR